MEKLADLALKLIRALTWRRVAMIAVIWCFGMVTAFAYLDRDYLLGVIRPSKLSVDSTPLEMSELKEDEADQVLESGALAISTIGIVSVDAQANTRRVIYFKSNDPDIQSAYDGAVAKVVNANVPLWTDRPDDNRLLIRTLNGETSCRPWAESISARYLKGITSIKEICVVGIPPDGTRFRGMLFFYIRKDLDEDERFRVLKLLRTTSLKLDSLPNTKD